MPEVRLKINPSPSQDWLAKISTEFPDDEFRVLASHLTDDGLLGFVEVKTPNADALVQCFHRSSEILSYEVLHTDGRTALVQYVIPVPESYRVVLRRGNLPRFPLFLQDGRLYPEMSVSNEQISKFIEELEDAGITFQILSFTQSYDPVELLTDRQQEFVTEALKHGYYDSPRRCTLTDLATFLDVNKSVVSGVLHRAEGKIIRNFMSSKYIE